MNDPDPLGAVTAADPYPYYARLIAERPFYRDEPSGMWVAASAEAVEAILTSASMRVRPSSETIPKALAGTPLADFFAGLVRMTDGPSQAALKDAVRATCDSVRSDELDVTSERCAKRLLGCRLDARSDLNAYIFGLPALVIAVTLGFGDDDARRAIAWTKRLVRSLAPGATAGDVVRGEAAVEALRAKLQNLIKTESAHGSPFATFLAEGRRRGIDDPVVVSNAIGFFSHSYDATAGLIGNVLVALASGPAELRHSIGNDCELLANVVDEIARYDAPIQNTRRFAVEDVTVMGSRVRAGDSVLLLLAAANRDPSANPDPHSFHPNRALHRTYTFGVGAHACPGARLATTIARAGVAQLMRSGLDLSTLHAAGYHPSTNARIPIIQREKRYRNRFRLTFPTDGRTVIRKVGTWPRKRKFRSLSIVMSSVKVRATAGARQVSGFVNEAVLLRLQALNLAKMISEHGVGLTSELLAEIDAEWPAQN